MTYMMGDSVDSDIKAALNAGLGAILYSPMEQETKRLLFRGGVPVIRHMRQLLEHLGITNPQSIPVLSLDQASWLSGGLASI